MTLPATYRLHPFRWWCQRVLPAVYDDSLSYYELLCKVTAYLNDIGENINEFTDQLNDLQDYVQSLYDDGLAQYVIDYMDGLVRSGFFDSMLLTSNVARISHMGVVPHLFCQFGAIEKDSTGYYPDNAYQVMQGGCMVGENLALYACNSGQDGDANVVLRTVDLTNGTVGDFGRYAFGHCNSLTYDKLHSVVWAGGYLIEMENPSRVSSFNFGNGLGTVTDYELPGLTYLTNGVEVPQRLQSFACSNTLGKYLALTARRLGTDTSEPGNVSLLAVYDFDDAGNRFVLERKIALPHNMGLTTATCFAWRNLWGVVFGQPNVVYLFDEELNLVKSIEVDKRVQGLRMATEIENVMSWDEEELYVGYLLSGMHDRSYSALEGGVTVTRSMRDTDIAFGRLDLTGKLPMPSATGLPSVAYDDFAYLFVNPGNSRYDRDGSSGNPFQSLNEAVNVLTNPHMSFVRITLQDDIEEDLCIIGCNSATVEVVGGGHTVTGGLVVQNTSNVNVKTAHFTGIVAPGDSNNGYTHWFSCAKGVRCETYVAEDEATGLGPDVHKVYCVNESDVVLTRADGSEELKEFLLSYLYVANASLAFPENTMQVLCRFDASTGIVVDGTRCLVSDASLKGYRQRFTGISFTPDAHMIPVTVGDDIVRVLQSPMTVELPVYDAVVLGYTLSIPKDPVVSTDSNMVVMRSVLYDDRYADIDGSGNVYQVRTYFQQPVNVSLPGNRRTFWMGSYVKDVTNDNNYYENTYTGFSVESL